MLLKNLKSSVLMVVFSVLFFSCKDDDNIPVGVPPNDRTEQYAVDIGEIEDYLKTNYLTLDSELNATIAKIPIGGSQVSIWNQTDFPLQSITVKNDDRVTLRTDGRIDDPVEYKLYFIVLNEGGGERPLTIDSSFVDYKGWNLDNVEFDRTSTPVWTSFPLSNVFISGFRQILPEMKTAESVSENGDGTLNYLNFGNCLVFIPSGLGYFNIPKGVNLPSYSNLVFQIKLKSLNFNDHDSDRILSYMELYGTETDYFMQDSDGDLIPDFLDTDDDEDGFLTRNEFKISGTDPQEYYDFTTIPDCSGNTTNPIRLKRYLDPSCHQ
jgi:hypothetical protein